MKITPVNLIAIIIVMPFAIWLGVVLGRDFPLFGLIGVLLLVGFVVWILASNNQGAAASPAQIADAMTMRPPAGKARIYVTRKGFVGGMQGMNVTIDDRFEGQMRSKFFMVADVEPGTHTIRARMAKQPESTRRHHDVTLDAGQAVMIDVGLEMGMVKMAPFFTEVRDMVAARQQLGAAKLIQWLRQA